MNKDMFWKIINEVNMEVDRNDQDAVLKATEEKLMAHTADEIADWYNIMWVYLKEAQRNDLWAACTATWSHDTDDGFLDFRTWLISQGKEIYMRALHNPDSLADYNIPKGSANFEEFGYVPVYAYEKKMALEHGETDIANPRWNSIYYVANERPVSEDCYADIMAEIKPGPDISPDWDARYFKSALPRLIEKYGLSPSIQDKSVAPVYPYLNAYVLDSKGNYKENSMIKGTAESIASFIVSQSPLDRVLLTTPWDMPFIESCGGFISYCADQQFLVEQLHKAIIPMQLGETEPGEIQYINESENLEPYEDIGMGEIQW